MIDTLFSISLIDIELSGAVYTFSIMVVNGLTVNVLLTDVLMDESMNILDIVIDISLLVITSMPPTVIIENVDGSTTLRGSVYIPLKFVTKLCIRLLYSS